MGSHRSLTSAASAAWLLVFLAAGFFRWAAGDCHTAGAAYVNLVLQSQRNGTGHRNIRVALQTRGSPGNYAAFQGGVEASQSVRLCNGLEIVDTHAVITAPPVNMPPPGYETFPGLGYYKFHATAVTWDEAYQICVREGTHLLVLNSEAEANVLRQFLGRKNTIESQTWPGWAWAGYHDRGLEGDYVTVLGGPLNQTGYTKWHPGQPDNKAWGTEPDQDCGSFNKDALLNDLPCLGKIPFICEMPM